MTYPTVFEIAGRLPDYRADNVTVDQVRHIVGSMVAPLSDIETVALRDALDRILALDVMSTIDVPAHDNAAMDGYAFHGGGLAAGTALTLEVIGAAFAGCGYGGEVAAGQCVRIMTGAPIPAGCDSVIAQEAVAAATADAITIAPDAVKAGANVRLRGEDLQAGKAALNAGKLLRPAELGLLASLGIGEVKVRRRLRVAVFSTGDELRSIGEILGDGCIYDSNRYTLLGMLRRLGCEVRDGGPVRDDPAALETALRSACAGADVVITSGGVSAGAADYTPQVTARLGDVAFWQLAMRPGRPMAFGSIASDGKRAWLFGLPGNPVAVMVAFYCIVREALLKIAGANDTAPLVVRVTSQSAIRKKPGRTEYQRGILARDEHGNQQVRVTGSQGSGVLRSMSEANCLILLRQERGNVEPGEPVDVLPFDGLI